MLQGPDTRPASECQSRTRTHAVWLHALCSICSERGLGEFAFIYPTDGHVLRLLEAKPHGLAWPGHCRRTADRCPLAPAMNPSLPWPCGGLRARIPATLPWKLSKPRISAGPRIKEMTWVTLVLGHPRSRAGRGSRWAFVKSTLHSLCPPTAGALVLFSHPGHCRSFKLLNHRSNYDTLLKTLYTRGAWVAQRLNVCLRLRS